MKSSNDVIIEADELLRCLRHEVPWKKYAELHEMDDVKKYDFSRIF